MLAGRHRHGGRFDIRVCCGTSGIPGLVTQEEPGHPQKCFVARHECYASEDSSDWGNCRLGGSGLPAGDVIRVPGGAFLNQ